MAVLGDKRKLHYRNIVELNEALLRGLDKVPPGIDMIVGIPRSGLLAANMLALYLHCELTDVAGFLDGRVLRGPLKDAPGATTSLHAAKRRVLVIDDSISTGEQMSIIRAKIDAASLPHNCIYGAVYSTPRAMELVDLWFEIVPQPRIFQWNVMKSDVLERSCVDIDGVLCRDPSDEENDDGKGYEFFLQNAEPKFLPNSRQIGWLVTCRLERYRALTERWLADHGVKYRELIMLDLPSKAARIAARSHAKFKADAYLRTGAERFIESSRAQAREIFQRTAKPVLCTETWEMEPVLSRDVVRVLPREMLQWSARMVRAAGARLLR